VLGGARRFGAHRGRRGAGAHRGGRPPTACYALLYHLNVLPVSYNWCCFGKQCHITHSVTAGSFELINATNVPGGINVGKPSMFGSVKHDSA